MKKSRLTKTQIVSVFKEVDAGLNAKESCRKRSISPATGHNWKNEDTAASKRPTPSA